MEQQWKSGNTHQNTQETLPQDHRNMEKLNITRVLDRR